MSTDRLKPAVGNGVELLKKADNVLSTDFCPSFNKYVYWLKNPFWVLVLAIGASLACGLILNPLAFLLTALLVGITAIGVVLPWLAIAGIRCKVVFDVPRTRVGQAALVRLIVTNRWPLPVWGLSLIRGFANDSADGDEGLALTRVPGWATVEFSWPFEPSLRGRYPNETAVVETSFPFGLFRASRDVSVEGQLIAWPKTVRLKGMPDASESQNTEEQFSERRTGEFGDMMGTRTFRPGDSLRRVHWSQTARQQTLIVTERQAPAMACVQVVIDLSESSHPIETRQQTIDLCVETAASICESLHKQHSRVELLCGDEVVVASDALSGYLRMMDTLAVADVQSSAKSTSSKSGFEIRVTTQHGSRNRSNEVVVGDGSSRAWLTVPDRTALDALPRNWRRVCHA